jgi:lipoprotein-anchoring transpeptidase ErfK/SrfK
MGTYTKKALALHTARHGAPPPVDVTALTSYTITAEDTAGPFVPAIPDDLVAQASLPTLAYTSVAEAIAERFHTTPDLLRRLNPHATFAEGEQLRVPNVEPLVIPAAASDTGTRTGRAADSAAQPTGTTGGSAASQPAIDPLPALVVTVSKAESMLTVADDRGTPRFSAPVTTGSERDPLPIGEWSVTRIQIKPAFHYNPDLFWDADPSHSKAKIAPGPNNPVGLVWIDINRDHYGIHGTPEPAAVGRSQSHGCVRLTNWDALRLAGMIRPGTRVIFTN